MAAQESLGNEARIVRGLLRELEGKCKDPTKRDQSLRGGFRGILKENLPRARRLLGEDHRVMPVVIELMEALSKDENITRDLAQEDSAYIARALEDRFLGTSGDDMNWQDVSYQEAKEAAGLLREIENKCGDPERQSELLRGAVRSILESCLQSALGLLNADPRILPAADELFAPLIIAEDPSIELTLDMVQDDSALVARILEDRFRLGPGGGYGGGGFSISEVPDFDRSSFKSMFEFKVR